MNLPSRIFQNMTRRHFHSCILVNWESRFLGLSIRYMRLQPERQLHRLRLDYIDHGEQALKAYAIEDLRVIKRLQQESPHEHQQSLLLSRIINNVVRHRMTTQSASTLKWDSFIGEAQWGSHGYEQEPPGACNLHRWIWAATNAGTAGTGDQRSEHQCRARCSDVQELSLERPVPSRR